MTELIDGLVEANGIRLHYCQWAAGGRDLPPVVLVHATGFLARLWQPVAEALASRFTVHALDLRGHGDSDKPLDTSGEDPLAPEAESIAGDYHWQNFVDDLAGFMDALSLKGAPIVGHSSGGAAAVYLAATRPEYVSKLVLIEPIIIPSGITMDEDQRGRMAEGARKRRQVWASTEEMVTAYRTRPTFEHWQPALLQLYADEGTYRREDGQIALKCPGEIEAQVFENSASLNIWDILPRVDSPALVMKGERTEGFLALVATGVAGRMPNARLVTIANAGHLAPMERPEAVSAEVLAFLAE
ncbi:MAG TPA: alpha/beta hydrolase [Dehalococcoidia bacterium]|nr:alpha/beta hydrolase [Dehalococcoidia bacterium]